MADESWWIHSFSMTFRLYKTHIYIYVYIYMYIYICIYIQHLCYDSFMINFFQHLWFIFVLFSWSHFCVIFLLLAETFSRSNPNLRIRRSEAHPESCATTAASDREALGLDLGHPFLFFNWKVWAKISGFLASEILIGTFRRFRFFIFAPRSFWTQGSWKLLWLGPWSSKFHRDIFGGPWEKTGPCLAWVDGVHVPGSNCEHVTQVQSSITENMEIQINDRPTLSDRAISNRPWNGTNGTTWSSQIFDEWGFPQMGIPHSWMVYNRTSHKNRWSGGTPIYGNPHSSNLWIYEWDIFHRYVK